MFDPKWYMMGYYILLAIYFGTRKCSDCGYRHGERPHRNSPLKGQYGIEAKTK
jgi:hypothetical protein